MSRNPDDPKTIARHRAYEEAWERAEDELWDELDREPTDDEIDSRAWVILESMDECYGS